MKRTIILAVLVCMAIVSCTGKEPEPYKSPAKEEPISQEIEEKEPEPEITEQKLLYIPGIAACDLHMNLTDKGFELETIIKATYCRWECTWEPGDGRFEAMAYGDGPEEITMIDATVLNYSAQDTNDYAVDFLSFIATLPYEGSSPDEAKKWIKQNIGKSIITTFGPVKYELIAKVERARLLIMSPIDE